MPIVAEMEKGEEGGLRVVIVGGEIFLSEHHLVVIIVMGGHWTWQEFGCESKIILTIGGMMGAATAYYLKQLGHAKVSRWW